MAYEIINDFLTVIAFLLNAIGVLLLIYSSFLTVVRIISAERKAKKPFKEVENVKRNFVQKIIFALDFFLVADLIKLAEISSINEIIPLAAIVIIRTILSWSLGKEIHLHEE